MPQLIPSPRSLASRLAPALIALSFCLFASAAPVGAQGLPDFSELVEKVGPAVVNIRTTERPRAGRGGGGSEADEDMLELFRRFGIIPPGQNRPGPALAAAARRQRSRAASARASSSTPTAT